MKRRYDRRHKRIRAKWAPIVASGQATCARCGKWIQPGTPWDLDHSDDDPLQREYLGASHARCNRQSVTHLRARAAEHGPYLRGHLGRPPENRSERV